MYAYRGSLFKAQQKLKHFCTSVEQSCHLNSIISAQMVTFHNYLCSFYTVEVIDFPSTNSSSNSNNNKKAFQCSLMRGTSKALFKVKCTRAVVCLLLVVELAPSVWCWCPASYSVGNSLGGHSAPPSFRSPPPSHTSSPESLRVDGNYSGGFER